MSLAKAELLLIGPNIHLIGLHLSSHLLSFQNKSGQTKVVYNRMNTRIENISSQPGIP